MSTGLFDNVNFESLSEEHLQTLPLLKVGEDQRLEFKRELNVAADSARKEFCKDVSAFANAVGGYLCVGIEEDKQGIANAIPGIDATQIPEERLTQIITNGISPHLQRFQVRYVPLQNGKQAVVMRIDNDGAIHQVKLGDDRFYKRVGKITMVMDAADMATFHTSTVKMDRTEEVQRERAGFEAAATSGQFYDLKVEGGVIAISIIPRFPAAIPIFSKREVLVTGIPPIYSSGWDFHYHQNSVTTSARFPDEKAPHAVTELIESGTILAAEGFMLSSHRKTYSSHPALERFIPSVAFEREIISSTNRYFTALQALGTPLPWFLGVSLLNIRGYTMYVDPWRYGAVGRAISSDDVCARPVEILGGQVPGAPAEVAQMLKPVFDEIWRSFNYPRSLNYANDAWEPS
ncbi:MAG TPA: ATP-binding protein [Pirellulales bacterium]